MSKVKYCDYKIITQDDDGNLAIGYFVIKDIEALNKICTIMLKDRMNDVNDSDSFFQREEEDNFNIAVKKSRMVNGEKVPKVELVGDKLIRRTNFKEEYLHTFFDEYTYEFAYLNSFLIFSSLLEDFDWSNSGSIAKNFMKYGIIKKSSFSEIWASCSKDLVKNKFSRDFSLFKDVFDYGIIEYVQLDKINFNDLKNKNVLKNFDVMLSEIAHNSEMLGTYNKGKHYSR